MLTQDDEHQYPDLFELFGLIQDIADSSLCADRFEI
jgi:hypothetical protein